MGINLFDGTLRIIFKIIAIVGTINYMILTHGLFIVSFFDWIVLVIFSKRVLFN